MNKTVFATGEANYAATLQNAVDEIALSGGGILTLSAGLYYSGSVELKSNVCLCLQPGCVLKAIRGIENFEPIGFWHLEMGNTRSLLWARNAHNITLCGAGTIDFSDEDYYDFSVIKPFDVPEEQLTPAMRAECVVKRKYDMEQMLSQPLFFESCEQVQVQNVTLRHAPCWTLTFSRCQNVQVTGVTIQNRRITGNSDGIHLSAVSNAVITGCSIVAGDDCVAATCITAPDDWCENIVISNCNFQSSSAGVRLGHLQAKVKNVCVSNLNITHSNRGIAIFAHNGGRVQNVHLHHLNLQTQLQCGAWWGKGEAIVLCAKNSTGSIADITVDHIHAESDNGILIAGSNNIQRVRLQNVAVTLLNSPNTTLLANDFDLRPNDYIQRPEGRPFQKQIEGAAVELENVTFY